MLLFLYLQLPDGLCKIVPAPNSTIRYAQVMFESDAIVNASSYVFQLKVFNSAQLISTDTSAHPAFLNHRILNFDKKYQWRVIGLDSKKRGISTSHWYTFTIKGNSMTDRGKTTIDIIRYDSTKTLNGLVLLDNNIIIDRNGKIVLGIDKTITNVRDLTLNYDGNFTFLDSTRFFEMDKNLNRIWSSPLINNDSIQITDYHHDIVKTGKGSFLCMAHIKHKLINQQVKYCALIEFNKKNEITWFWSENTLYANDSLKTIASHMNSIDYDEQNDKIYCSNRDLSSLIKIDRKTKQVEYSYGYNANDSVIYWRHQLFKRQHRIIKLANGNFLLFNNDSGDFTTAKTSILEITDPEENSGESSIAWKYEFNFAEQLENYITHTGGAIVLPNDNVLIATGTFNRSFEVTRDGEIAWEIRASRYDEKTKQFSAMPCYRNNFVGSLYPNYTFQYKVNINGKPYTRLLNAGSEGGKFIIQFSNNSQQIVTLKSGEYIDLQNSILRFAVLKN